MLISYKNKEQFSVKSFFLATLLGLLLTFFPVRAETARAGGNGEVTIRMVEGHLFQPAEIHVRPGGTIVFINNDEDLHSLTLVDHEDLLDEEYIDPGKEFRFVLPDSAAPGSWQIGCYIHTDMKGKIVIDPPASKQKKSNEQK